MKTECSKCDTPMSEPSVVNTFLGRGVVTGYRCAKCGHFNNLKRRNGFAYWKSKQLTGKDKS